MTTITGTHPYADKFPYLPAEELRELADSIAANGLRNPVVITDEGLILDGRNRAAACELLGITPETVIYEGTDFAEYVIDCNVTRRNMSTGARAMSTALVLLEDGRRENGRWTYGAAAKHFDDHQNSSMRAYVARAGVVLDYKPELADDVVAGTITLDNAYQQANEIKRSAEAEKVLERERRKRAKEEAAAEAERNARIMSELAKAESPYVALIESEQMTPKAAWAAYQADTEKERRDRAEIERGRRDTCMRIAEVVRHIDGGTEYGEVFLTGFYPYEAEYVPAGMRLERARVRKAIDFLTTIEKGLHQ